MVPWRDIGVVQDSDEDDSDIQLDQGTQERDDLETADDDQDENGHLSDQVAAPESQHGQARTQHGQTTAFESSAVQMQASMNASPSGSRRPKPGEGHVDGEETHSVSSNGAARESNQLSARGSDVEYDELPLEHLPHSSLTKFGSVARTNEDSERERPSSAAQDDIFDIPSSPLTELSLNDSEPSQCKFTTTPLRRRDTQAVDVSPGQRSSAGRLNYVEARTDDISANGRTFRRRNPIQMHPYLLENEQYRKTLQTRGLRPVHVAATALPSLRPRDDESQFDGDVHLLSSQQSQTPSRRREDPTNENQRAHVRSLTSDEEFPDLVTFSRKSLRGEHRAGVKRRKLAQVVDSLQTSITGKSDDDDKDEDGDVLSPGITNVSPPRGKREHRKKFRFPPGFTPAQLPTPVASSELSRTPLNSGVNLTESEEESLQEIKRPKSSAVNLQTTSTVSSEPVEITMSQSSGSTSDSSEAEHLRRAQKRIRGVLPASWLKFDNVSQKHKNSKKQLLSDPPGSRPIVAERGVARKVRRGNSDKTPSAVLTDSMEPEVVSLSNDDDNLDWSRSSPQRLSRMSLPTMANASTFERDTDSDMEHDQIDPMLQASNRTHRPYRRKQKHQSKVTDIFSKSTSLVNENPRRENSRGTVQAHLPSSRKPRTKRPRHKTVPHLSVLDAPPISPSSKLPSFVSVAQRQVRSKPHLGRHSPTRKRISMHTQQEGAAIDEVINDWQQGRLQKVKIVSERRMSVPRTPLAQRAPNRQTLLPNSITSVEARKPSSVQVQAKPVRSSRRPLKQGRLQVVPTVRLKAQDDPLGRGSKSALPRQKAQGSPPTGSHSTSRERQGQLEELQADHDAHHPEDAFRRGLLQLDSYRRTGPDLSEYPTTMPIATLLESDSVGGSCAPTIAPVADTRQERKVQPLRCRKLQRRRPQWLDLRQIEVHQPALNRGSLDQIPSTLSQAHAPHFSMSVEGLGPYGTQYTRDFGIAPLPVGVCFRETTFVGSGELKQVLALPDKDLTVDNGSANICYEEMTIKLGSWTSEGFSLLGSLSARCFQDLDEVICASSTRNEGLASNVLKKTAKTLRMMVKYLSSNISILDAIDKRTLALALIDVAQDFKSRIADCINLDVVNNSNDTQQAVVQASVYLLALCVAGLGICKHPLISQETAVRLESLSSEVVIMLAENVLSKSAFQLQTFHDPINIKQARETGVADNHYAVEAIVTSFHLIKSISRHPLNFWSIINAVLCARLSDDCRDVQSLEQVWHTLFAMLPLLEIGSDGILRPGSRFECSSLGAGMAATAQKLMQLTFGLCSSTVQPPALNAYVRAILTRSNILLRTWGWRETEDLMVASFMFFARNGLRMLRNEATTFSFPFLETLDIAEVPPADSSDHSFHIFLKTLAIGIKRMSEVHPEKRVKNFAWRFVPNHGRSHNKELELMQEDLDALRNHHDLLSVLSYAPPVAARPKLTLLRNLADFRHSHVEVCRLNIRAWGNLLRHRLSTSEDHAYVQDFGQWFNDMVAGCVFQHKSAHTEAEAFRDSAVLRGHNTISQAMLDSTIAINQRNIESMLESLLSLYSNVLAHATDLVASVSIFEQASPDPVFGLFDVKHKRSFTTIRQALGVYEAILGVRRKQCTVDLQRPANSESQDYGDWPSDDEIGSVPRPGDAVARFDENVADRLFAFICTMCGVDGLQDDELLECAVDVYTSAVALLVDTGRKKWTTYVEEYTQQSWSRLPDTDQTRRFNAYFHAKVIEIDNKSFKEVGTSFISQWLASLVERESMLKYQHRLTAAMLNADSNHSILRNLPFIRNTSTNCFDISLEDFRTRRVGLIASVLSNVRSDFEDRSFEATASNADSCETHLGHLRSLTSAMKRNYQETQCGTSTRGAYVTFVQTIIQFLQQYTSDIMPIDRFFTDSTAFPLPVDDPLYITGRLRSYQLRGSDPATQKKLAVFIQTAADRAAAENQQDYFATQLHASVAQMCDEPESSSGHPSLRKLLLEAIFPAYIEVSLSRSCGGFVVRPVLESIPPIIADFLSSFDLADRSSLQSAVQTVTCVVHAAVSVLQALGQANPLYYNHPETPKTIANFFGFAKTACPLLDFAIRSGIDASNAVQALTFLVSFGRKLGASVCLWDEVLARLRSATRNAIDFSSDQQGKAFRTAFPQTLAFTKRELISAIAKNWERIEAVPLPTADIHTPENPYRQQEPYSDPMRAEGSIGRYRVLRTGTWRDLSLDSVEDINEVNATVWTSRDGFFQCLRRMDALGVMVGVEDLDDESVVELDGGGSGEGGKKNAPGVVFV